MHYPLNGLFEMEILVLTVVFRDDSALALFVQSEKLLTVIIGLGLVYSEIIIVPRFITMT